VAFGYAPTLKLRTVEIGVLCNKVVPIE